MHRPIDSTLFPIYRITASDAPNLFAFPKPPQELWIQGSARALALINHLPEQGLTIVGTRNPKIFTSTQRTLPLLSGLRNESMVLISGFATGIDRLAHETSIALGLPTIAVLGCGIGYNYPAHSKDLKLKILQGDGLLISEYAHLTPPLPYRFLRRNELLAAWAKAILILEAPEKSGAMVTARHARNFQKDVYCVPALPWDTRCGGNLQLLDQGTALPFLNTGSLAATWPQFATTIPELLASWSKGQKPCRSDTPFDGTTDLQRWMDQLHSLWVDLHPCPGRIFWEKWIADGFSTRQFFDCLETARENSWIFESHDGNFYRQAPDTPSDPTLNPTGAKSIDPLH